MDFFNSICHAAKIGQDLTFGQESWYVHCMMAIQHQDLSKYGGEWLFSEQIHIG